MKKILIVINFIFLLFGCGKISQRTKKTATNNVFPVEVKKVMRKNIWEKVELTGDIHGYLEAKVFSKVPGKIISRTKNYGDKISKDETILTIDRDEPALEYAIFEVKTPFAGIITKYFVNEGEVVSLQTPVAEVASIDKIKIIVQVSEEYMAKLKLQQNVKFFVDAYPEREFNGRISNIAQALDKVTRTTTVEILSDNPGELLKPGMFARVEILIKEYRNALVIPKEAIIFNPDGDNIVFVATKDNKAQLRKVVLGIQEGDLVQIISGLNEGEEVVTVGQYSLSEGVDIDCGICRLKEEQNQ